MSGKNRYTGMWRLKKIFKKYDWWDFIFSTVYECDALNWNSANNNFIKERLWHGCFPLNFEEFLRTPFLTVTPPVAAFLYCMVNDSQLCWPKKKVGSITWILFGPPDHNHLKWLNKFVKPHAKNQLYNPIHS